MPDLAVHPDQTSARVPGWARGRSNALADGIQASASWSLEAASGEGFLFFWRGWTMEEHQSVSGWLRALGWDLEATETNLVVSSGVVDVAGPRLQIRPVAGLPLLDSTQTSQRRRDCA